MKRVTVFIDAQNFYRNARRAFFDDATDAYTRGQFRPEAVGAILASRDPDRTLTQGRRYTGRPDANLQPKAHRANVRQCQAWEAAGCYVFHRPLRYPPGWPSVVNGQRPEEKGIDVAMAVDIVRLAQDRAYDVAIVCTGDTALFRRSKMSWTLAREQEWKSPGGRATITGSASPCLAGTSGATGWTTRTTVRSRRPRISLRIDTARGCPPAHGA